MNYKSNTSLVFNCNGIPLDFASPKIMGIVNITPDSFYDGGKNFSISLSTYNAIKMLEDGADIIDIGGQSTKPNAVKISAQEELDRIALTIQALKNYNKNCIISIDTYYSYVAKEAVAMGANIINDISSGTIDSEMIPTVAALQVPYFAMHIKGTPQTMQINPTYNNVTKEVYEFLNQKITECTAAGITNVGIDVGFGFGKTKAHNFELLKNLNDFKNLQKPILVGVSRKSMIYKTLNIRPENALNGSTFLHAIALQNGAHILRVHDVVEAKECVELWQHLK
jgi:dihydropteroate synthase